MKSSSQSKLQDTACESAAQPNYECSGSTCFRTNSNRRNENSLETLCARFYELYNNETEPIQIDVAASKLCIQRRRMYEIFNIIQSVGLIARIRTGLYQWKSKENMVAKIAYLKRTSTETFRNWKSNESIVKSEVNTMNRKKAISTLMGECFIQVLLCERFPQPIVLEDVADIVASLVGGTKHICLYCIYTPEFAVILTHSLFHTACSRRLYDIANVFCGLGLLNRIALKLTTDKNCRKRRLFKWCGPVIPSHLSSNLPFPCPKTSCEAATLSTSPLMKKQEALVVSEAASIQPINAHISARMGLSVSHNLQNNPVESFDTRSLQKPRDSETISKSSDELELKVNVLMKALEDSKARELKLFERIQLLESRLKTSPDAELSVPLSPSEKYHRGEPVRSSTSGYKNDFSPMLSQELSPVTQQILGEGSSQDQLRQYVAFHISPLILTSMNSGTKSRLLEPQSSERACNGNIRAKRRKIRVGPSLVDPTESDNLKKNGVDSTLTKLSRISNSESKKRQRGFITERIGREQVLQREGSNERLRSSATSCESSTTMSSPSINHPAGPRSLLANATPSSVVPQSSKQEHQCSAAFKSSTLAIQFSQHFLLESPSSIARTFDRLTSP
nr:PREDICTED: similar to vomeronasal receptor V1RD8 pu [Albugo laibachii Nc14]|eukprot:CCA19621.1 PREDICTED: similar to vomeronasal receptor V1RD8 pu [Albugo laibachii Nc14]